MSRTSDDSCKAMLHRAAWVAPVTSPPVADGAVLTRGDVILAVGRYREIKAQSPAATPEVDHGAAALIPALINAHTHLELTALQGQVRLPQESFPAWLKELLPLRACLPPEVQQRGVAEGERQMAAGGIGLYGDITNGASLQATSGNRLPARHIFMEVLGFDRDSIEAAVEPEVLHRFYSTAQGNSFTSLAAHACYSTSAPIMEEAKEWCRKRRVPFAIHAAEHPEEVEFLRNGSGFCRDLLESLGRETAGWKPPGTTPVAYLDRLKVLDSLTLLVHCIHLTEEDWDVVAARGAGVCFCPRSNRNLNVGRADMERALHSGVPCALGTDSLASTGDLSLFAEAAHVLDHYPGVSPEAVLQMMTIGGARALGHAQHYGSLEAEKRSAFLAVSVPDGLKATQFPETIIHMGNKGEWQWAGQPMHG